MSFSLNRTLKSVDEILKASAHRTLAALCPIKKLALSSKIMHHGYWGTKLLREQGWRSGESARLPPMWPGFDSWTRRHMWVEFVVSSRPAPRVFLRVLRFSSLLKN